MSTTELPTLASNVQEASDAIMHKLRTDGREKWDARELMDDACGGMRGTVASIALWNLASDGEIVMDDDDHVSLPVASS